MGKTIMDYLRFNWLLAQVRWTTACPAIESNARTFLQEKGSMTAQLQKMGQGEGLGVIVLHEQLSPSATHWKREVILSVDRVPCIWAQSIIPSQILQRPLQNEPLGNWLFRHKGVTRSEFQFALIKHSPLDLPVRRSEIYIDKQPSAQLSGDFPTDKISHQDTSPNSKAVQVTECLLSPLLTQLAVGGGSSDNFFPANIQSAEVFPFQ